MITHDMIEVYLMQAFSDSPETKFELKNLTDRGGGRAQVSILFATKQPNGDISMSSQRNTYVVVDGVLHLEDSQLLMADTIKKVGEIKVKK